MLEIPPDGRLPVYLEATSDQQWTAHVLDLPGCVVFANDRDSALDALRYDVTGYLEWLQSYGETVPPTGASLELYIAETVPDISRTRLSGEQVAIFGPELDPVTDEQIERAITLLEYTQQDLERLVAPLDDAGLARSAGTGQRTVREILEHVRDVEGWYLTRLEPETVDIGAMFAGLDRDDPLDALRAMLELASERFRRWSDDQRSRQFVPQHFSRYGSEIWTGRKVLRRFVEHRREHLAEIRRTLAQA
jgi:uncharacterized damage-inducible protein DinB/predicted RNase H-like HicB family nuclease